MLKIVTLVFTRPRAWFSSIVFKSIVPYQNPSRFFLELRRHYTKVFLPSYLFNTFELASYFLTTSQKRSRNANKQNKISRRLVTLYIHMPVSQVNKHPKGFCIWCADDLTKPSEIRTYSVRQEGILNTRRKTYSVRKRRNTAMQLCDFIHVLSLTHMHLTNSLCSEIPLCNTNRILQYTK